MFIKLFGTTKKEGLWPTLILVLSVALATFFIAQHFHKKQLSEKAAAWTSYVKTSCEIHAENLREVVKIGNRQHDVLTCGTAVFWINSSVSKCAEDKSECAGLKDSDIPDASTMYILAHELRTVK